MFKTVGCKEFFESGEATIQVWMRLSHVGVASDNRFHKASAQSSGPV
jgi:hypothetical protein